MMFYKENNFQNTLLGKIPRDWQIELAENLCEKVTDGTHDTPKPVENGFFLVTSKHIKDGKIDFSESYFISKEDFEEVNKRSQVDVGDILFSMIGTVGLTAKVSREYPPFAIKNVGLFKVNGDDILANWLNYYFHSEFARKYVQNNLKGTTQKYIPLYSLRKFPIVLPPISEQKKIVGVLGVVDSVVGLVDRVILKTERLKKGLMQTLLTRGIGHKEYKQTPIGTIPKEWQIVKLGEVVLEAKSGFASGKRDENGILQLRMDNIETEGWINPYAGVKVPIPPDVEEYLLKPNDILFNNTNSVDLIGKTAIFRGELPKCVYSNHLTRIRVNPDRVIPEWVLFVLIRKWQTGVFRAICHRHVHQAGINNSDLLNIKIPLTEIPEQQKIAQILSTTDKKLKIERQEKAVLEKIKQGLMDLLLTGKIRVKVD